jgi:hypothetical protein
MEKIKYIFYLFCLSIVSFDMLNNILFSINHVKSEFGYSSKCVKWILTQKKLNKHKKDLSI